MDIFQFPDDYKPERPLTHQESEEITNYLLNHPLFMKQLPKDISSNEHLVALQQLVQDDPIQQAQNLNKQANARLKQDPTNRVYMKQAYEKYSQAISIKCKSVETNAKLHANRAALNLRLKNYGKVIEDCKICLKFDPNYAKGYYRYGKALNALNRYKQCIQILKDREQPEIKQLINEATKKLEKQQKKQQVKKQQKMGQAVEIREYFMKKNWKYCKREQRLPEGAQLKFIDKVLSIPLVILYPEFKQFDLIASTHEKQKVWPHFKQMIQPGLPWDTQKLYTMDTIQVYCEVAEAIMMKIPKQVNVGDVASRVVIKQAIQFVVVCKTSEFYKYFLSQNKII